MNNSRRILEGQIREIFGRLVYTHKVHEKCADILLKSKNRISLLKIVFSTITTAGLLTSLSDISSLSEYESHISFIALLFSATLLTINSYEKDRDYSATAHGHRQTGAKLWFLRENTLSLLADLASDDSSVEEIKQRRDRVLAELQEVYKSAPSSNSKAYRKTQQALQKLEDMTFTDKEIDDFLPGELKRNHLTSKNHTA